MSKTKQELIEELDALQRNYADEKTTIGETLNSMSNQLIEERTIRMNLELMMVQYEKTIMILTKRLLEAREP
tara:strand:+ start:1140 stop:1355 length:216 start_codon:yes stop_codon:yes gene_type:complete